MTIFLLLVIISFIVVSKQKSNPDLNQGYFIYKSLPIEIIKDGDIITRLGNRFWSDPIRNVSLTDQRFSHVGVIRIRDEQITVIHAEGTTQGEGVVKEESIRDFLNEARSIGIYRLSYCAGTEMSDIAIEYIGIPFDWQFDMDDDTKLYCTELIYAILQRLKPVIKLDTIFFRRLDRYVIPLEAISNSEYFEEVYFYNIRL